MATKRGRPSLTALVNKLREDVEAAEKRMDGHDARFGRCDDKRAELLDRILVLEGNPPEPEEPEDVPDDEPDAESEDVEEEAADEEEAQ